MRKLSNNWAHLDCQATQKRFGWDHGRAEHISKSEFQQGRRLTPREHKHTGFACTTRPPPSKCCVVAGEISNSGPQTLQSNPRQTFCRVHRPPFPYRVGPIERAQLGASVLLACLFRLLPTGRFDSVRGLSNLRTKTTRQSAELSRRRPSLHLPSGCSQLLVAHPHSGRDAGHSLPASTGSFQRHSDGPESLCLQSAVSPSSGGCKGVEQIGICPGNSVAAPDRSTRRDCQPE